MIVVTIDRTSLYKPEHESIDFMAIAAHELRGPVTVIRGYLDVLNNEIGKSLNSDQQQLLERITVSSNRLNSYINNVLNASRSDKKLLKLHLREERLQDVLSYVKEELISLAKVQNRLLVMNIPSDLPTVAVDKNSVSEVINNLVDNAIKYSREGGQVVVKASVKGDFVELTVLDYGIGIPRSVVGNLFTKFYRSHRSKQSVSGTGLGLYLSKNIIESRGALQISPST